tara:strand:+ start:3141 stop:3770 length:630 start_codon:yes stop_codon:yes gene_type:complete
MAVKRYRGLKSKSKKDPYRKTRKYSGIKSESASKIKRTSSGLKKKVRPYRILEPKANTIPIVLPVTDLSRRGLTLRQLIKSTPKFMRLNGEECAFKKWKKTTSKVGGRPAVVASVVHNTQFKVDRETPHQVTVIGLNPDLKLSDRKQKVMVSCDCENYLYVWEYANAKHGAAKIIYGNGEAPVMTNPGESPGLCKHASAVADRILAEGI